MLFCLGMLMVACALSNVAVATDLPGGGGGGSEAGDIIKRQLCNILELLEGPFGALVMVVAGLGAVVAAAMGGYKLAMSCVVIACGTYIAGNLQSVRNVCIHTILSQWPCHACSMAARL